MADMFLRIYWCVNGFVRWMGMVASIPKKTWWSKPAGTLPLFIDKMLLFTRKVYAILPKAIVVYHRGGV
jgi:hypothetical protein